MPTGSAAARHEFGISSAGVVMKLSSEANSKAGSTTRSRKARAATTATTSRKARTGGETMPTRAVMRMCSPRWNATHGPQHGEPEEQDRGQLVRPDERLVKDVAGDHAGEQDADLDDDEHRGRDLDHGPEDGVHGRRPVALLEERAPRSATAGTFSGWVMAPTPACRRLARGSSRPRRRTWPSSRGRSSSCAALRGTAPGRRR